jgi:membrane-associated phospholipid phosphatase
MLWTLVLNVLCSLLFYLPVRLGAHLADGTLARADAALGFSSAHLVAWTRAHPRLDAISAWSYESLEVFGIACVALPPLLGRVDRAQTMLLAIVASVVATLALAAVVPAVGPWETEATPPTPAQAACADVVHRLASGAPYAIDLHFRDPIVALPSWHTIFAVLGALVWRPLRLAWPIAVAWSALIVVSTLTTGWHYPVDVLAGIAIALAAHGVASASLRTLHALERTRSPGAGVP